MRTRILRGAAAVGLLVVLSGSVVAAGPSQPPLKGEGKGLKIVANVPTGSGTDMEMATIKGREYAFVASRTVTDGPPGGLNVIDITKPENPKLVAKLPCNLNQGDIQLSHDLKTVIMAADSAGGPDGCLMVGKLGFMTIDISNPLKPRPLGVAEISRGSHNTTAHPTKPFVYNSNSDQAGGPEIQIWSIKNPAKPKLVNTFASLPHAPHDIAFNKNGSMAVTAARTHVDILDTSDPANPTLLATTACPGCYLAHDAKFTPNGKYLIVGDEAAGGQAFPCPGGALYFYELVNGFVPVLRGIYEPGEVILARDDQGGPSSCTSHVFDVSDDSTKIAISWYTAGTRYLDISNPVGPTFGEYGTGVKELGWFMPDGGDSWASKFHKGPYIYSNDISRGFDVFKITVKG
ncbi:MAG: hypothetical protein M3238_04710 [Actinomycetota bacterium]|nr:hypothetical protein [Actinomycetota bacterium]